MKRFASVGLGWVAREVWLPAFKNLSDFEIVGAVDPDPDAVKAVHMKWPEILICDDMNDLVELSPDIVLIAVPNCEHVPAAEFFLEQSISVLIEKPVCLNSEHAGRLKRAALKGNAHIFPSKAVCLRSDIIILKQIVADGILGELRMIELDWIRACGIPEPGSWFTNKKYSGGGVALDLGWHMLDVGLSFLSYPEIKQIASFVSDDHINSKTSKSASWRQESFKKGKIEIDVEDNAVAFFVTTNNIGIKLHVAWASHEPCDITKIVLHGTKSKAVLCTTFGFSPKRLSHPTLNIYQDGKISEIELIDEPLGIEYQRQADQISTLLHKPPCIDQCVDEIACVSRTIEQLYRMAGKR